MAEVTTGRATNASQLCVELGRVPMRFDGPDEDGNTEIRTGAVTQAQLEAAIESHVADPNWTDPNPPPATQEQVISADLQAIRARAIEVFNDPTQSFTSRQSQRLLAALVLRATR